MMWNRDMCKQKEEKRKYISKQKWSIGGDAEGEEDQIE